MNDFKNLRTILLLLFMMLILAVVYTIMVGCTKTVKNVVEVHDTTYVEKLRVDTFMQTGSAHDTIIKSKTDTVYQYKVYRDSITLKDSIYIREKGDTVYQYVERWRTRVDLKHDTIYKAKTDTVYKDRMDTIVIYRFREIGDSTYLSSDKDHEVVKEKKTGWKVWLKFGGLLLFIFGGLWLWQHFATKK